MTPLRGVSAKRSPSRLTSPCRLLANPPAPPPLACVRLNAVIDLCVPEVRSSDVDAQAPLKSRPQLMDDSVGWHSLVGGSAALVDPSAGQNPRLH